MNWLDEKSFPSVFHYKSNQKFCVCCRKQTEGFFSQLLTPKLEESELCENCVLHQYLQRFFENMKVWEHYVNCCIFSLDRTGLFCEILVQRPIMNRATLFLACKLTNEEIEHMRKVAANHFDEIMEVLKAMPRQLLLIIRCVCLIVICVCLNFCCCFLLFLCFN